MRALCFAIIFFAGALADSFSALLHEFQPLAPVADCTDCEWTSVQDLGVGGRATFPSFPARESFFHRLPLAAKSQVRPALWNLSTMPAGIYCDFATTSPVLFLNVSYTSAQMSMFHFSATGASGLDLYAWDDAARAWRFASIATTIVYPVSLSQMQAAPRGDGSPTAYRLHLPTYNGVLDVRVGAASGHVLLPLNRTANRRVAWYGTSILQGAVASRPGMIFTAQISRALGWEVFNFGFSGNGLMELNVSTFLADLDVDMFIIDCAPNMLPDLISNNTEPLVQFLRSKRPLAQIVLVGPPQYGSDWINSSINDEKRAVLHAAYSRLIADGFKDLHLIPNANDELYASMPLVSPTVEGIHPTDLGHVETANFYIALLNKLI